MDKMLPQEYKDRISAIMQPEDRKFQVEVSKLFNEIKDINIKNVDLENAKKVHN